MNAYGARAHVPGPLRAVELIRVAIPLVRPFRTARGVTTQKDALLVHVVTADAEGWGECSAERTPGYSGETLDGARLMLRDHLVPRAFAGHDFAEVRGNQFARAALEAALLDAHLRATQESLASHLGGTRSSVAGGRRDRHHR